VVFHPTEPFTAIARDGAKLQHNPKSIMEFVVVEKSAGMVAADEIMRSRFAKTRMSA
jgi:hypothetical protein